MKLRIGTSLNAPPRVGAEPNRRVPYGKSHVGWDSTTILNLSAMAVRVCCYCVAAEPRHDHAIDSQDT